VTPTGTVLPCPAAAAIRTLTFASVRDYSLAWIWRESPAFNAYRGEEWMQAPCKTCPRRTLDFGGCRCQAFLLTGEAAAADPVCHLSPEHSRIEAWRAEANQSTRAAQEPFMPRLITVRGAAAAQVESRSLEPEADRYGLPSR
jgi:pyrroloquinoline quinone biosynthesis protein E